MKSWEKNENRQTVSSNKWDAAVAAFEHAGDYNDAIAQITEVRYLEAKHYYDEQNFDKAYEIYKSYLAGYEDTDEFLRTDENMVAARNRKIRSLKTLVFGLYEQDNNLENGQEGIL